jgi:hypothetical protein
MGRLYAVVFLFPLTNCLEVVDMISSRVDLRPSLSLQEPFSVGGPLRGEYPESRVERPFLVPQPLHFALAE